MENGKPKANPLAYDCPSNEVITHRILSSFPQLVPAGFQVSPLPSDILSFARQAIQIFESSLTQKQKLDLKAKTQSGGGGKPIARSTLTVQTQALLEYPQTRPNLPAGPSSNYIEDPILQSQEALLDNVRHQWRDRLSAKPSALWVRRCGTVTGHVPFTRKNDPKQSTRSMSENT